MGFMYDRFSSNIFSLIFFTALVQFCDINGLKKFIIIKIRKFYCYCPFKRRNGAAGWMCAQGAYPGALNLDLLD